MFGGMAAVAEVLVRRPVPVTLAAGALTAGVPSFVIWTMSGLENALLALTAVGMAAVLVRATVADRLLAPATAVRCGLLAALAALTRPDGLIYAAALPLAALLLLRRGELGRALAATAVSVGVCAVPVGGYLMWRLATFGQYLPNTAVAKAQGLPGTAALARPAELVGYVGWLAALLAAVVIGWPPPARRGPAAAGSSRCSSRSGWRSRRSRCSSRTGWRNCGLPRPVWPLGALATVIAAARVVPPAVGAGARRRGGARRGGGRRIGRRRSLGAAREFRAAPTAPLCLVAQNTGRSVQRRTPGSSTRPGRSLLAPDLGGRRPDQRPAPDRPGRAGGPPDRRATGPPATWPVCATTCSTGSGRRSSPATATGPGPLACSRTRGSAGDYIEIGPARRGDRLRAAGRGHPGRARPRCVSHAARVTAPADAQARRSPRSSCGDVLVPG